MEDKKVNFAVEYSRELEEISYILYNLENGRIYERTGWTQDGYLATNIQKLRNEIINLLVKIQNGEEGEREIIRKALKNYSEK